MTMISAFSKKLSYKMYQDKGMDSRIYSDGHPVGNNGEQPY